MLALFVLKICNKNGKVIMKNNGFKILSLENDYFEYSDLFNKIKKKNIFFHPSYLKSVQYAEKYPVKIMVFVENEKIMMIPYVFRRINDLPLFNKLKYELLDIISPYEYSYIFSNITKEAEYNSLLNKLFKSVENYCKNNNIVTEFIRFDPFLSKVNYTNTNYFIRKSCDNVYIDLRKESKEIIKSFHRSVKKNINRAVASNLKFIQADKKDENIDSFINLYRNSMQRLKADDYYYFSDEYFRRLIKDCESVSLFFVQDENNPPFAASILLHYGDVAHHHLTGYNKESKCFRPNDYMIYSLIHWAKNSGLKLLHLGGGSESICKFKSKFSNTKIPYYIGYKVHNLRMYQVLCNIWRKKNKNYKNSEYFPLYRSKN